MHRSRDRFKDGWSKQNDSQTGLYGWTASSAKSIPSEWLCRKAWNKNGYQHQESPLLFNVKLYLNYNPPFGRLSSSLLSSGSLPSEGVAEVALWVGVAGCWWPSGAGTRLVCCEAHLASVGTLSGCVVKHLESVSVPAWGRWNEMVSLVPLQDS